MLYSSHRLFREQFRFLRRQFLQDGDLPLSNVLSEKIVADVLEATEFCWVDRIYTPLVTLWVFLSQVLSADHSCRAAVARLISHRISHGQTRCSPETGAYCTARKRLPEKFFSEVARQTGKALDANVASDWLWKGRPVYIFDGSTVTMPDTSENQAAYPQIPNQRPGLGFPIARIAAVFSLSCGAVVDLAICRYAGKGQSELGMLRTLLGVFRPGDVMLADGLMCAWTEIAMLKQRGVDYVCRLNRSNRSADFRRGTRLGKEDHLVRWLKPNRPRSMDQKTYKMLPDSLMIRECRFQVEQPGFRTKTIINSMSSYLNASHVTVLPIDPTGLNLASESGDTSGTSSSTSQDARQNSIYSKGLARTKCHSRSRPLGHAHFSTRAISGMTL